METEAVEELRKAYHKAFSQVGWSLTLVLGGLIALIVILCWSLIWSSETIRAAKPFDKKRERKSRAPRGENDLMRPGFASLGVTSEVA